MDKIKFKKLMIKELTIRHLRKKDFNPYYDLINDTMIQNITGLPKINNVNEARYYFYEDIKSKNTYAILENNFNDFIGIISFYQWIGKYNFPDKKSIEVGFALLPDYQYCGYMAMVLNSVCNFLKHHSKINKVWCGMFSNNLPCQKLMSKTNFKFQFKINMDLLVHKELYYARILN